jgi:hypothetical protein
LGAVEAAWRWQWQLGGSMAVATQRWQLSGGMAAWWRQRVGSGSSVAAAAVVQHNSMMAVEGVAAAWQRHNGSSVSVSVAVAMAAAALLRHRWRSATA